MSTSEITRQISSLNVYDELTVLVINIQTAEKHVNTDTRRSAFKHIINSEYSEVIMMQECRKKDITEINKEMKKDGKMEYLDKLKPGQAAVLLKKSVVNKEEKFEECDFARFLENEKNLSNLEGCGVRARLILTKVITRDNTIMIGSWHGPYKGCKREDKKVIFKELCRFLIKFSESLHIKKWLVGGDFNLHYREAEDAIPTDTPDIKISVGQNERARKRKNSVEGEPKRIMFILHSKSVIISSCNDINKPIIKDGEEDITYDEKDVTNATEVLDHFPLSAKIIIPK